MMKYLPFFDEVPKIRLYDDLMQFLGVNDDGIVEISYIDIVKTAGHSCATVAGAYLVALKGLEALYTQDELPQRGYIKVEIKKVPTNDNAGVVGAVLMNITSATENLGFGGIPTGKFNRRNLLCFGADIECDARLTRLDTNKSVCVNYKPEIVVNPMSILKSAIAKDAKSEDIESFPRRFQAMVKTIFDNSDKVIEITK